MGDSLRNNLRNQSNAALPIDLAACTYLVGGAVRDTLLQRPVQDCDWVVVGQTPALMKAAGFLPVGRDFPVFLHPKTHEEYALARTERKTALGYHGFSFFTDASVTLAQDLSRRDLTINAMAMAACHLNQGAPAPVIDPYGGQQDLQHKILRHVTLAFREDPVRILRVARFAARFPDFSIADETMILMQGMVANGEVGALVAERVWQEIAKGLMEEKPSRMFEVLRQTGALKVLLPELNALWGVPQRADYHPEIDTGVHVMMVLDMAARLGASLGVRFACLMHDLGKGTTPPDVLPRHLGHEGRSVKLLAQVCQRWRVPTEARELAQVVAREHGNIHRSGELQAAAVLRLLERCDAIRRPARFLDVLLACACDARGRLGFESTVYAPAERLKIALQAVLALPCEPIAQQALQAGLSGAAIGQSIAKARVAAIAVAIA